MKQLLLLSLLGLIASAQPIVIHTKKKPAPVQPTQDDDDEDEKVVLANIANMAHSIGMLSTDPKNPAVAGPAIASFGLSVINIIVQMFKSVDIRGSTITHDQIIRWFNNLPEENKLQLAKILLNYSTLRHHAQ